MGLNNKCSSCTKGWPSVKIPMAEGLSCTALRYSPVVAGFVVPWNTMYVTMVAPSACLPVSYRIVCARNGKDSPV